MKINLLVGVLCALAMRADANDPSTSVPTLTGIVNLPGFRAAVVQTSVPFKRSLIIREGDRLDDFQLVRIAPDESKVFTRLKGSSTALILITNYPSAGGTNYGLILERASLDPVLQLYAEISRRSVLRPSALAQVFVSVSVPSTNLAENVQALERVLADSGLATIPDGDKFVMVIPKAMAGKVKARSKNLKSSDVKGSAVVAQPKEINIIAAPSDQVMAIYAEFADRKLDPNHGALPASIVCFQNVTPLTRDELLYGLDTVLALNGLKLAPVDGGLLRAEMISEK